MRIPLDILFKKQLFAIETSIRYEERDFLAYILWHIEPKTHFLLLDREGHYHAYDYEMTTDVQKLPSSGDVWPNKESDKCGYEKQNV